MTALSRSSTNLKCAAHAKQFKQFWHTAGKKYEEKKNSSGSNRE